MSEDEAIVVLSEGEGGRFILSLGAVYWEGSGTAQGRMLMSQMSNEQFGLGVAALAIEAIAVVAMLAYDGCGWDAAGYAVGAAAALSSWNAELWHHNAGNFANCVATGWGNQGGGGDDLPVYD